MEVRRRVKLLAAERVTEGITGELAWHCPNFGRCVLVAAYTLACGIQQSVEGGRRWLAHCTSALAPSR